MNVDLGIWGKLTRLVIFLLVVAGVMGVAVTYLPVIHTNQRMRERALALDAKIQQQEEINRQLKTATDALKYDPKAVERLARESLGYARPSETVILFEPASTGTAVR